jgi:glycosyltransferase involved in cell wall biosynthesis
MKRTRVLYIAHNHPTVRPGGAEQYALELYEAMRASDRVEPILVAKAGPPISSMEHHAGTIFSRVGSDPNQLFAHTDASTYDWLLGTSPDKELYTHHFRDLLLAVRPEIVHFQHTLFFGYDLVRLVRRTLPEVPIVYTLHELLPICHRDGQMVRTVDDSPCRESTPRRCHECFPDISPQTFFLRKRLIQSHLEMVDRFIAPSRFLAGRFVDWGIPADRILCEEYGRLLAPPPDGDGSDDIQRRWPDRFGFFGQLSAFKGVTVALEAMGILERRAGPAGRPGGALDDDREGFEELAPPGSPAPARPHLSVHGANLDLQPGSFQKRFHELVRTTDAVTFAGPYRSDEVAGLMRRVDWVVVPSVWWENSPLVIQEAFAAGRPVICSDIGGMAEKVTDGVNGLHFRVGDPVSLADQLERAAGTPGLWTSMQAGIPEVHPMERHVEVLTSLYDELLASARSGPADAGRARRLVEA